LGVTLQDGYGVSNHYSKGHKYDRGEPGEISYYLDHSAPLNPRSIAKVWLNPEDDVAEAAMIPHRLRATRELENWLKLADDIDLLQCWFAVAKMRDFAEGKLHIGAIGVTDRETEAAQWLSDLPGRMRAMRSVSGGKDLAARLEIEWPMSMAAWVKGWARQYIELKRAWLAARPALKISRGDEEPPLIIPKGKQFKELLRRWAT
jgi:hypothetical protein